MKYPPVLTTTLEFNQVAIYGPDDKVHYRRDWDSPMVEEALRTQGYYISGPAKRIQAVIAKLAGSWNLRLTAENGWISIG